MEITHQQGKWTLVYDSGRLYGPQKLILNDKTIFSFMHCRIDRQSDDSAVNLKLHHYHRGGCAVYEGAGDFVLSPGVSFPISCQQRAGGNILRITTDLTWPKDTAIASGIELGSIVLSGSWKRFLVISPEHLKECSWRELNEQDTSPISFSPLPTLLILENVHGERLEIGLGDDLWRWQKGFNSESLKGIGRLELSRSGSKLVVRRFITECPPQPKTPRLPSKPVPGANGTPPSTEPVRYIPDCRPYRFNSYISWSSSALLQQIAGPEPLSAMDCSQSRGLNRQELESLGATPSFRLDLQQLPTGPSGHRNNDMTQPLCWCSRSTQRCFRRIIRQIAEISKHGNLLLEGMTPGWCSSGPHANRRDATAHWDLCAIIDAASWTRQILGDGWVIQIPQSGIFAEMPSLSSPAAIAGFRQLDTL